MKSNKRKLPSQQQRIADGVSIRVRFASHKQIALIGAAASRRGIARDRFIQLVLQAASEHVMSAPAPPLEVGIEQFSVAAVSQLSNTPTS